MKKRILTKKLTLQRETLRSLEQPQLQGVLGLVSANSCEACSKPCTISRCSECCTSADSISCTYVFTCGC